ncbi:MAG: hypothetical protein NTX50_09520 [Candidatus Sumerlaeota bacterium]|nr:hypothetical protein [Candidatus Sumerlaeota bacterium]
MIGEEVLALIKLTNEIAQETVIHAEGFVTQAQKYLHGKLGE